MQGIGISQSMTALLFYLCRYSAQLFHIDFTESVNFYTALKPTNRRDFMSATVVLGIELNLSVHDFGFQYTTLFSVISRDISLK